MKMICVIVKFHSYIKKNSVSSHSVLIGLNRVSYSFEETSDTLYICVDLIVGKCEFLMPAIMVVLYLYLNIGMEELHC